MKNLGRITLFLMLTSALTLNAQAQKKGTAVDGNTYLVEILEDGKKKPLTTEEAPDDLKFTGGKFKSVLFTDWGFSGAVYNLTAIDTTSENKIYTFDVETKPNNKGETMTWSGTITGESIEGTAELLRNGKTKKTYTFSGTLKKKKMPGKK